MIRMNLQFFGGRGSNGGRNVSRGYPIFSDAHAAYVWAEKNYYDELERGEEVNIYVAGSVKKGQEFVVGTPDDRKNKKLPEGRRWRVLEM